MRIHAAGGDDAAGDIDLARPAGEVAAELHDAAAGNADVRVEGVAGRRHAGVAQHEVEGGGVHFVNEMFCSCRHIRQTMFLSSIVFTLMSTIR